MYYIYKITNNKTGMCYVGLTNNIARRRSRHFTDLRRGVHDNSFLQAHFNRDGESNFSFEVLFEGDITSYEIGEKEKEYIELYDSYYNGYNQNKGGNFGPSNGGSHLVKSDILNILSALEFASRPGQVLSNMFEVSRTTISRIKRGVNHCEIKEEYNKMPIEERKQIYRIFCESCDFEEKKAKSSLLESKRHFTEEQVYLILLNEELSRPITIKSLCKKFEVTSNTIYCILKGLTYQDYKISYSKLSQSEKDKLATLLRE